MGRTPTLVLTTNPLTTKRCRWKRVTGFIVPGSVARIATTSARSGGTPTATSPGGIVDEPAQVLAGSGATMVRPGPPCTETAGVSAAFAAARRMSRTSKRSPGRSTSWPLAPGAVHALSARNQALEYTGSSCQKKKKKKKKNSWVIPPLKKKKKKKKK